MQRETQGGGEGEKERDASANEQVVIVVERNHALQRHDLEKVEREDAEDRDELIVDVGIRDGEDDAELRNHLHE